MAKEDGMHEAQSNLDPRFAPQHAPHCGDGTASHSDAPPAIVAHERVSPDGQVSPGDASVPGDVASVARQRMRLHPHLKLQRIWCEFRERRLFLRGQVPSFYHKQLAQASLKGMDGLDQIVNEIEVVW